MSSNRERIEAARKVAEASGKPLDEVLNALAPTWGMSWHDLANLKHQASEMPVPPSAEQKQAGENASQGAAEMATRRQAKADAAAVLAFRNYEQAQRTNPHLAACLVNSDGDNIFRGRTLAATQPNDPPDPPKTAA